MKSKRITIYLDPFLIKIIDDFRFTYTDQHRGRIISIVVSFLIDQEQKIQDHYLKLSKAYIDNHDEISPGVTYGEISLGMYSVNLFVNDKLYKIFKDSQKKYIIVAAMIYVGLIKVD